MVRNPSGLDPAQMLERAAAQLRGLEGALSRVKGVADPVIWRDLEEAASAMTAAAQVPMTLPVPAPPVPQSKAPTARSVAFPPVDLFVTESMVVVNAAIPGVERFSDLKVTLVGDSRLRLAGVVPAHPLAGRAPGEPHEQVHGPFDRTIALPVPVRGDAARSFYHNGLLEVWLARQAAGERPVPIGL